MTIMMTAQISVSPNPFINSLQIKIDGEKNDTNHFIIRLIDKNGIILRMVGISLMKGINKITIDRLQTLSDGDYYLDVKNTEGKNVFSTKLVKK
jgi:hypothetical protein